MDKGSIFLKNKKFNIPRLNPKLPHYHWFVLGSIMIATFMGVLDSTIVNVALTKLMVAFGVSTSTIEWVLTSYMLIYAVMLPASGWIADHFGYKKTFLLGLAIFTSGSFLASISTTIGMLIIFRVFQGLGAGLLTPVGMATITREFPPQKRGMALGFWAIASSASASLGPTIGGYLIDKFSWHSIFDVNVPIGIIGLIIGIIVLREHKSEDTNAFDVVGFLSLSISVASLILALSNGNANWNTDGWRSNFIVSCFLISAIFLIVFLISERLVLRPFIDLSVFKDFNFAMSNIVLFVFGLGMFGSNFLIPLYLQKALGYTALQAGLVFLPVGILVAISSPIGGIIADKLNAKIPVIFGVLLMAFSLHQFTNLSLLTEKKYILITLYIRGFGMGFIFSPLAAIAISKIPNQKMAQASGLINVVRQIGGSLGVAIFGTMLTNRTIFHLATFGQSISPYSLKFKQTISNLSFLVSIHSGGTIINSLNKAKILIFNHIQQQAFVRAVDDVFFIASIVLAAAVMPILILKSDKK